MGQFVDAVVVDDLICWFKFLKRCEAFTRMLYYDFGDFHIFNYENASWKVFTVWIVLFSAHPSYLFNLMMFGWGHFFHESLSFYVEFHIWVCVFFFNLCGKTSEVESNPGLLQNEHKFKTQYEW